MRIDSIHIEGFGHFANRDFGPLDAPVTVFFGPNETGKSTILAFVRSVLFGFPTKLGAQHYPPLVGGRHGGLMNIADKNAKQYTLHRNQGSGGGLVTITDGCGETLDKSALGPLLGHHSQDVFKEVFAFTLDELHSEDLLKKDSVNSQIYSAGMGASRLPVALKEFKIRRTDCSAREPAQQRLQQLPVNSGIPRQSSMKLKATPKDTATLRINTNNL